MGAGPGRLAPQSPGDGLSEGHRRNLWFLSDEGLRTLSHAINSTRFEVTLAEEGALLIVAWLLDNGHDALALDVASELYPFISRYRFYPQPTERPASTGAVVHLSTVGEVSTKLKAIETPRQIAAMRKTLSVWNPLRDRLVGLWLDTTEGE